MKPSLVRVVRAVARLHHLVIGIPVEGASGVSCLYLCFCAYHVSINFKYLISHTLSLFVYLYNTIGSSSSSSSGKSGKSGGGKSGKSGSKGSKGSSSSASGEWVYGTFITRPKAECYVCLLYLFMYCLCCCAVYSIVTVFLYIY